MHKISLKLDFTIYNVQLLGSSRVLNFSVDNSDIDVNNPLQVKTVNVFYSRFLNVCGFRG
jgi:hypothetical protein